MKKFYKILSVVLTTIMFSTGCSQSFSKKSNEIVIWSHLTDEEITEVRKVADEWAKQTGNKVKVHSDKGDNRAYIEAAKNNIEPDIEFGVSHDRMEKLNSEKLLEEVPDGVIDSAKYITSALETASFNDKLYGIPISIETYALYYNKDKVKNVPETLEELFDQGKKLGFQYDINNFYLSFPFLQVNGAYIFNKNNGKYNVMDVGLNNEGAIKGYEIIQDMVQRYKLMPENIDNISARKNFEKGNTAFYISGSWDIQELDKYNKSYSVAPLPKYNGKQMSTFVMSQMVYVSSKSQHKEQAWDLVRYLVNKSPEGLFKISGRIPPLKIDYNIEQVKNNEKVRMFARQAEYGEVLPNVSEIQALQDTGKTMMLLTAGKITPKQCGEIIENKIIEFIRKEKQKEKQ